MAEYNLQQLAEWNERIEVIAESFGLDWYEQEFEICTYEDMLCYEAYTGMPAHYPHWSFGKTYERQKTYYKYNLTGLPYEMVINSNPCIAYLMRDNTLALQILTMAHVYGHNDFFKNNRLFKRDTRAEYTVEMFKVHADRVRKYIADPLIGVDKVEKILNAAHALRYNICRDGEYRVKLSKEEEKQQQSLAVPDKFREDLLGFLAEKGQLQEWERDLVTIVREETYYFIPQIETKIMNEGWASYWHYKILNELNLPQSEHLEFLQRHNMVIRPHQQRINPYYVGFKIFEYLDRENGGRNRIFEARAQERDNSFLRRFLNRELCEEMNLFTYYAKGENILVKEISDEQGWRAVRDNLANNAGLGAIPAVAVKDIDKGTLKLEHQFDGRELEFSYARETIKYIVDLWGGAVELATHLDGRDRTIFCADNKMVSVKDN